MMDGGFLEMPFLSNSPEPPVYQLLLQRWTAIYMRSANRRQQNWVCNGQQRRAWRRKRETCMMVSGYHQFNHRQSSSYHQYQLA